MDDLKRQNEMADTLIQKMEQIKKLWEERPTEDDLDELQKHAHGFAKCLEQAREAYMNEDFPSGEALQEVAKEAAVFAETLERCDGDGPHDDEADSNASWPNEAKTAAAFFGSCEFHHHRGVYDCGDKIVVFGNRGYRNEPGIEKAVQLVQEHLEKLGLVRTKFGTTEDGHCWAIVALNYDGLPVDIDELRTKLSDIWTEVSEAK